MISAFFRFGGVVFILVEILLVIGYFIYLKRYENLGHLKNTSSTSNIISAISFKKISIICFLMIIPWIAVFSFYFSFNDYYFGDPIATHYTRSSTPENPLPSILKFDSNRIDSIIFYSSSFVPDYRYLDLIKLSSDDQASINNWISFLSFLILGLAFVFAFYFKEKRTEIVVFLSFIFGVLLFYSSDYATSLGYTQRFMLPVFPLTFTLIGFLILGGWKIIPKINSDKKSLIMISRICFVSIFSIFLILSFFNSIPIQRVSTDDFSFKEHLVYANRYPLDMEGLTEKSIIVSKRGMSAVDYNVIPLALRGVSVLEGGLDMSSIYEGYDVYTKKLVSDGNDLFTFKEHKLEVEPLYFRYIESEYGILLKDYSKTFCKLVLKENSNESDDLCYVYKGRFIPKN